MDRIKLFDIFNTTTERIAKINDFEAWLICFGEVFYHTGDRETAPKCEGLTLSFVCDCNRII